MTRICDSCRQFFARFRCSAASHGECDCPKCQGYCECSMLIYRTTDQKIATLKAWLKRRADQPRGPVTADELIARIRRNWPTTSDAEVETLYQAVGHL